MFAEIKRQHRLDQLSESIYALCAQRRIYTLFFSYYITNRIFVSKHLISTSFQSQAKDTRTLNIPKG